MTDGNIQDGTPRVSEAAIQISRCRVSKYLSLHTGYDLLPDSGKVRKISCPYYGFIFNLKLFLIKLVIILLNSGYCSGH